jgi:hypothetical protein
MCWDDALYSSARLCGVLHELIPGNGSLGLLPPPDGDAKNIDWAAESHGDAGVIVIDVTNKTAMGCAGALYGKVIENLAIPGAGAR